MARRRQPAGRKRRTREHIIADLAMNHMERFIFRCGHSRTVIHDSDYGIDLILWPHSLAGDLLNGEVKFQVKSTDAIRVLADGSTIAFPVETRDLNHWLGEIVPVILTVYDAMRDCSYWLDIKSYGRDRGWHQDTFTQRNVTVRIPMRNRLNAHNIQRMCRLIPRISDVP